MVRCLSVSAAAAAETRGRQAEAPRTDSGFLHVSSWFPPWMIPRPLQPEMPINQQKPCQTRRGRAETIHNKLNVNGFCNFIYFRFLSGHQQKCLETRKAFTIFSEEMQFSPGRSGTVWKIPPFFPADHGKKQLRMLFYPSSETITIFKKSPWNSSRSQVRRTTPSNMSSSFGTAVRGKRSS